MTVKISKKLRVVAMALVLALCAQIMPIDVFAQPEDETVPPSYSSDKEQEYVNVFDTDSKSSTELADSEIITELSAKREENIKYFLLTDGSIAAAVYNNAVHELDEKGKWKDIDNTLSLSGESNEKGEEKKSGGQTVSTANVSHSDLTKKESQIVSDSSLTDIWSLPESLDKYINSVSTSDAFELKSIIESSSQPEEKTSEVLTSGDKNEPKENAFYEKSNGKIKIQFSKKAKDGNLLSIEADGYSIKWGLNNTSSDSRQASLSNVNAKKGHKKTATKSVSGILQYDNVMPNVDLTYQLVGNDIKENIVLNKAGTARVFEFALKCDKLNPSLENNQILLKNSKNKVVSTITAPYMVDALDKYSSEVKIELISDKKSGSYTVKLTPDEIWLNAEERAYPVVIDPTIEMKYNINNIDNTSLTSQKPNSSEMYRYGAIYVGKEASEYQKLRGLLKFTLPSQITESDMIIDASINLTQMNFFGSGSVVVNAHKITEDIALSSATWNNANDKYDSNVVDTQTVSSSTVNSCIVFDITTVVREWYLSGNNYGLAFVSENEAGSYKYATFYSATHHDIQTEMLPSACVTFRNNDGIEDYLTYHEMGSDSMGTAYVGDFNGNMVYTYDDVSTDGNYMPLTVSHVYNHSQRDKANLMGGDMRFGYGMRLNLSQRIQTAGITGYSYKWTDADGTVHYFKQNADASNLHEEEFNTGRTITVQSDNTFKLNDGGMEDYIFTSSGYLKRINDTSNGKNIVITYNGTKITKVKDGAGRETVFAYNSNNYLTSITDPAGRSTSYTYSGGYLTGITKPDNTSISYTYATDGTKKILTRITDTDGSAVGFEYFAYAPRRVKTVTEYGTSSGQGNKLTYTYNAGETKITDINNRSETMMFDNYSHTVCVRDGEGNAVYGSYNNTSDNKQNTLKYQSDMQSTVTNYLLNHDFEYSALSPWENYSNAAQGTGTVSLSTAQKYMGNKSMQVKSTSSSGRYGYMQPLTLEGVAGSTYTFSTFVKITDITAASSGNSGLMIAFSYKDTNGSWHLGRRSFIKNTCDWQRVSHTITFPENLYNNYFRIVLGFENATGTAYFDSCQLEESAVVNRYNLLENGHFKEASGSNSVSCWTGQNLNTSSDKTVTGRIGRGYKIIGESKYKNIEQTLNISGNEGETFVFGAWGKANAIAKHNKNGGNARDFAVRITFNNSDSTVTKYYFDFEAKTANWQYLSGSVSAPQNYTGIKIALLYNNQRNYAVFDDVQLYHETFGTKYTYYGSGRVSSETDSSGNKITYAYWNTTSDDLRLVSYYNADGQPVGTEEYRYNNDMQVIWYKDINGLITTYNYDENGNLTDAEQTADGTKITSGETESGNYVSSSTDNLGHTVTYDYNPNTGVLNSVTDANGTETNYTYNPNNDRLLTVTTGGSTNTYTYSGNHVSSITHNINANGTTNVTYNFVYDQFGNVTNVKVGNVSLMSYQYGANNGNLTRSTYGNGDYVENVYDNLDRVKAVKYNGVEKFRWAYGANGSVGLHTDLVNGVKWQYDYNLNGDVTSVVGNNGTSFRYKYRSDGVLTGDTVTVGGVSRTTAYTNTTQGVLTQIQYGNSAKLHFTYDGFSRVTGTALGTNVSSPALATSYSYLSAATSGETTDIVSGLTNTWNNGSLALNYTYDANGNIVTIKEGTTQKVKYYYDALNQVTREDNAWLQKTLSYSYDNGGNIQTVKEYALTSGSLDGLTATNTYNYLYGDSNWKDKLTSYNGHAIAYDAIGNPTTYYNGATFTWQNGRELAGLTTASGIGVTYTYNADGFRTQKTVGTVTTDYTLEGDKVVYETNGTDTFWYYYDESGAPVSFEYKTANQEQSVTYYYVKNLQGDIIAILDEYGNKVVTYKYDAWGNVTIDGDLGETIGIKNPYRYRGYRYDAETGLYYLQSRYYDPHIGRFINADAVDYLDASGSVLGCNLFAYCENNPVNNVDPTGHFHYLIAALLGGSISLIFYIIDCVISKERVSVWKACLNFANGALNGILAASGARMIWQIIGGISSSIASIFISSKLPKKEEMIDAIITAIICGTLSGILAGTISKGDGKHISGLTKKFGKKISKSFLKSSFGKVMRNSLRYVFKNSKTLLKSFIFKYALPNLGINIAQSVKKIFSN